MLTRLLDSCKAPTLVPLLVHTHTQLEGRSLTSERVGGVTGDSTARDGI